MIQQHTFESHPRVRFTELVEIGDGSEEPIQTMDGPSQLIVASSNEDIVTPKSIFKPLKYVVESENSTIAARVKARRQTQNNPPAEGSIADRVARCQREVANTVLDHKTGELLEYRKLLHHPKHKPI